LQTAVQMFIEKGYRQTSLDDVAKKLKITKPALYYYFHNKEAIYLECYRRGIAMTQQSLDRIRSHEGSGLEKVAGFIQTYTVIIARILAAFWCGRMIANFRQKRNRKCAQKSARSIRACAHLSNRGMKTAPSGPCNVRLVSFSLAGAIHSLANWFEPGGPLTAEQVGSRICANLNSGTG
jgi:AcrR family transcriptional regulator